MTADIPGTGVATRSTFPQPNLRQVKEQFQAEFHYLFPLLSRIIAPVSLNPICIIDSVCRYRL